MQTFDKKRVMPASAQQLYDWHLRPGAFDELVPPWQRVEVLERPDRLTPGARLVMKVYLGPIGMRWEALHRDFEEGRRFVDEQVEGPFDHWVHTHRFEPRDEETSVLHDHIEYRLPLGLIGRLFGGWMTRRMLERMFEYRHERTRQALSGESARGLDGSPGRPARGHT